MLTCYEEIKKTVGDMTLPCTGKNNDGEDVIIEHGKDEAGKFFRLTTVQKNNWMRINYYYESGDQTETYER